MSFVLEDKGAGGDIPPVKYVDAPLPVKDFKAGSAYLCDLRFDDTGPRLLAGGTTKRQIAIDFAE